MTDPAPGAMKLAARAVKAARIKPRGAVTHQQMERAVAGALIVTHPRAPHGQALMRALSGPMSSQREPTPEVRAIRWLVARGQAPTEAATAARVADLERRRAAGEAHSQAARSAVAMDGPRAAAMVAEIVARTGAGPTWRELGEEMGWPRHYGTRNRIMRELAQAGWLAFTDQERSLRPGSQATAALAGQLAAV
jgi:hypothetical protein